MVRGHMQHAGLGIILIASLEVVLGVHSHVTRGHKDILVVRDIHPCRIVHLIVGASGDGE